MTIPQLRRELEEIRAQARAGDLARVVQTVDEALSILDDTRLLTTSEAARLLGIRSVNTLKLLVRRLGMPYEMHGNRMMLALSTLESLQQSVELRGIQASDRAHDEIQALDTEDALPEAALEDLARARPGRLPWQS